MYKNKYIKYKLKYEHLANHLKAQKQGNVNPFIGYYMEGKYVASSKDFLDNLFFGQQHEPSNYDNISFTPPVSSITITEELKQKYNEAKESEATRKITELDAARKKVQEERKEAARKKAELEAELEASRKKAELERKEADRKKAEAERVKSENEINQIPECYDKFMFSDNDGIEYKLNRIEKRLDGKGFTYVLHNKASNTKKIVTQKKALKKLYDGIDGDPEDKDPDLNDIPDSPLVGVDCKGI